MKKNNDTAMWLKIIRKSRCYLLDECLGMYRRRQGSITPPDIRTKINGITPCFMKRNDRIRW